MRSTLKCVLSSKACTLVLLQAAMNASAQADPLSYLTISPITDNNPATSEVGRDRVSINSTPFKNESLWTVGDYQFTTAYRDDSKLMVMRRDLTNPVNDWDILVTEFTSYNIDDSHNVPVIGIDGDGYLHLAWGTHANPLLYTRSTTPVTAGQALSLVGQATGNAGAINTMTGSNETGTTYPNFIAIPGSGDLLFNYRTGGSGNGTYRITRWNDATNTWTWADQTWIKNAHAGSSLTYNAYPHNLSYDDNGGLHATWTYRYNSSSPTGNSGFQTNHNLHYAFSPDNGVTWFKDINATIPYPADIDESNSQVIVNIPEGSSLINTGTQAIDAHGRPAIATWWAPHANDASPDHTRQYMYVGHDGNGWFTTQITQRSDEGFGGPIPESSLGTYHMGRPQILFDNYNRAFVIYKDYKSGGGITVAYSQAESRDDWEFIQLTTEDLGRYEPTPDRTLWDEQGKLHLLVQTIDGNSGNGGSELKIVEWDAASAMGRVLKWTAASSSAWDGTAVNFADLGTPDDFDDLDSVTFDDTSGSETVQLAGNIDAGKVVVDSGNYLFTGPGALTGGSLSVVGGASLELATDGNTYAGPTRIANATLKITGDASAMSSRMVIATGGTLVMDASNASTMTSEFEIWQAGTLQIGTPTSTGNVFPDGQVSIANDGLIRVYSNETFENLGGRGSIEVAGGTTTLKGSSTYAGTTVVKNGLLIVEQSTGDGDTSVQAGGVLKAGGTVRVNLSVSAGGTLKINPSAVIVPPQGTLFQDDFNGTGAALNGTTPDVSLNAASWVASPTFLANGDSVAGTSGGTATLAFTPEDGNVYTLEVSAQDVTGDSDWIGIGFANGQSSASGSNNRFITGSTQGLAWGIYRGTQISSANRTFLGDTGTASGGIADAQDWLVGSGLAGGSVQMRIILDTTGGTGSWTVMMEADTGSGFQIIRAPELLLDESINSVGFANSNPNDLTATFNYFSLITDAPVPGPQAARTLTVQGDALFDPGSALELNLFSPTDHDVLHVVGTLHAGGTLAVAMDAGASTPQLSDQFDLLDFAGISGAFDAVVLPSLGPGLAWDTASLYTTGALVVVEAEPIPGDTDGDGDVDDSDLGNSFANYTGPVGGAGGKTAAQGDTDGDGDIDDSDLGTSFSNYTGPLGPTNVPEPGSLALLGVGGLWVVRRRRFSVRARSVTRDRPGHA